MHTFKISGHKQQILNARTLVFLFAHAYSFFSLLKKDGNISRLSEKIEYFERVLTTMQKYNLIDYTNLISLIKTRHHLL